MLQNVNIGIISFPACQIGISNILGRPRTTSRFSTYDANIFRNTWHCLWKSQLGEIYGTYGFQGTLIKNKEKQFKSTIKSGDIVRLKCIYYLNKQKCDIYVKHENQMLKSRQKDDWNLWLQNINPPIVPAVTLQETDDCVELI